MDPLTAIEVIEESRDYIVGIKVRLGRFTSGKNKILPFEFAKEVAEKTNLPIMVHIDEAPPSYSEVLDQMRQCDILTHCFRPLPNSPISSDKKILSSVIRARERGVLFDVGHGMGSFSFEVAKSMMERDFYPDTISSDIHAMCLEGPAHDLVTTLSKFLNLGMPFYDVIKSCTHNASIALNRPEIGNLRVGSKADVALLKIQKGQFEFFDVKAEKLIGKEKITAYGVVLNGKWWHPS
jgi:dihydroorotase